MPPPTYDKVSVVLAEPQPDMSAVLETALSTRGLRDVTICHDADSMLRAIDAKLVDVLLCDIGLDGLDFRAAMQSIRHREIGHNPFIHIVAMSGVSRRDQVYRLIGAGVDDLIRLPMDPKRVASRFDALTRPRKPFVVGETYIGPNRRKTPRAGDGFNLLEVPNSLRSKSIDKLHVTRVRDAVDRAWSEVEDRIRRSRRDAIGTLTKRVLGFYDGRGTTDELQRDLRYLIAQGEELISRHRNTETAHIAEIAACMTVVTRRIMRSPTAPAPKDVKLMPHLAGATRMSVRAPTDAVDTVGEIVELIRDYLKLS